MRVARIDENICDRSPFCPAAMSCKFKAFKITFGGAFRINISIDEEKCTGCGVCTRYCVPGAIELVDREKAS
ncbi:ATP-binding protein [Thermoanaerobacter mathranii]|uniref:ATP-binding protein n=1 Tax=Thermoanaerobacter mathranii TaxID=583357 RepID=UPI003AAF6F49